MAAFTSWTKANSLTITGTSPNKDWFSVTTNVSVANDLFAARFTVFTETASQNIIVRTLSFSLPSEMSGHILAVDPTTSFHRSSVKLSPELNWSHRGRALASREVSPSCDVLTGGTITPACLQALYGIPKTPVTMPNNTLLVPGYSDMFPQREDLEVRPPLKD